MKVAAREARRFLQGLGDVLSQNHDVSHSAGRGPIVKPRATNPVPKYGVVKNGFFQKRGFTGFGSGAE